MNLIHFLFRQIAWQEARLQHLTERVDAMSADQSHLDNDVTALQTGFAEVVAELKAQQAAGQPLDFTKADEFVGTVQAEAAADAPPAPAPAPPVDAPTQPTPVDGTPIA